MSKINWLEVLGWKDDQIEDIRLAGYSYIRQGKYDIALPFFEALCTFDRESAYDLQTLGALYLQLGQHEKAIKTFDKALKIEADHAPTLINLTKALFMVGRHREALKLAEILSKEADPFVSNMAKALLLAYG
jgi:tetratricopeptide (TPR) repeat protein